MPNFPPELAEALAAHCACAPALQGEIKTLCSEGLALVAAHFQESPARAMQRCLAEGLWPLRFARNAGVFSAAEQSALLSSHAFIAGCGGLGGHVATLLARAGVGAFTLCDGDVFSESNLNRQLLCREDKLGKNKAQVAAGEIAAIASHARVTVLPVMLDSRNVEEALAGVSIVMDCLDSVPARALLAQASAAKGIAFVHGAIAANEGFISLIRPQENTLRTLYGDAPPQSRDCAEHVLGVPTVTPAATAALQAALALQALSGAEVPSKTVFHLDVAAFLLEPMRL